MKIELSASEAVYGFAGWLSGRKQKVTFSHMHDAGIIAELVDEFCLANDFEAPRDHWEKYLVHPPSEFSNTPVEKSKP